ncbi:MAG: hypothetical protein ACI8S3_001764, partial [Alphaproteobacteria bacterium]
MDTPRVSKEEMLAKHVVRFADCRGSELAYL